MIMIGLDIGTTSISGLLYDLEIRTVLHSTTEEQVSKPFSPNHEWERLQEPGIILQQAERILGLLLSRGPEAARIGLTGQMHGIVYIDQNGNPLGPLYTWQDGRGNLPSGADNSLTYAQQLSRLTGYHIAPGYGLATHYYNLQHQLVPEHAVQFCTIADYIAMRLANSVVPLIDATHRRLASGATACRQVLLISLRLCRPELM
ncbi:FGGY family carbohydrate kinase [Paenibacillus sp. FSL R7-0297]|uniref:FGGY family carbohydrate kinase n=1 Tax=Paenibacillus sp. FSL R7-0297 TaxID=2921680 RepID=UPI0030F55DD1